MSHSFNDFPKTRIELPEEFRKIYSVHYKNNREGKTIAASLSQKMENWLHKKVANDVANSYTRTTLEIGAGTLNHLKFEKTKIYDIIEPYSDRYLNSIFFHRINRIYKDIGDVSEGNKYDRIISIATFEHIINLPDVIAKTCLHLTKNGTLRVSIPNEGTFLWELGWKLTTGIEFRLRYGLDYGILMKYEHVNTADEIEQILKYFYEKIKCSFFGVSRGIAFYRFYECAEPRIDLARKHLKDISGSFK